MLVFLLLKGNAKYAYTWVLWHIIGNLSTVSLAVILVIHSVNTTYGAHNIPLYSSVSAQEPNILYVLDNNPGSILLVRINLNPSMNR